MIVKPFMRDIRGSAVHWFALAAVVLSVASMAGAQTLAWLSQPGRVALVAYRAPETAPRQKTASGAPDIDMTPTGSIPSNALMIRIR